MRDRVVFEDLDLTGGKALCVIDQPVGCQAVARRAQLVAQFRAVCIGGPAQYFEVDETHD